MAILINIPKYLLILPWTLKTQPVSAHIMWLT